MPIHEYTCRSCGFEFEALILANAPAASCPSCGSQDLERAVSGFAVSSEGTRLANLHRAKQRFAASADYVDKRMAVQDEVREHLAEDGIPLPPRSKVKP
jgi:putative FmdB family regulatory protein